MSFNNTFLKDKKIIGGMIMEDYTLLWKIEEFLFNPTYDHMVFPGMVYITFATEMGTIYTLEELQAISDICCHYNLPLFIDGARLGYGLMAEGCDITLQQLADLCDVFYLGGTKCGAYCGEAVVFPNPNAPAPAHFSPSLSSTARCWPKDVCWASSSTR